MPFAMVRMHGNGVIPEQTDGIFQTVGGIGWTDRVRLPQGWGKTFRFNNARGTWFHFAVPTITNLDGARLWLDQFFVFFSSDLPSACGVTDVHVFDGSARVWTWHTNLVMSGDWSNPRSVSTSEGGTISNTWVPRLPDGTRIGLNTAFGISLQAGAVTAGNITFHSAGCNFVDSSNP